MKIKEFLLSPFENYFSAPELELGYMSDQIFDTKTFQISFLIFFIIGTSGFIFCRFNNSPEIGYTFSETKEIVTSIFDLSTFTSQFSNEMFFSIFCCGLLTLSLLSIYRLTNYELKGVDKTISQILSFCVLISLFFIYLLLHTKSSSYSVSYRPSFRVRKQRYK